MEIIKNPVDSLGICLFVKKPVALLFWALERITDPLDLGFWTLEIIANPRSPFLALEIIDLAYLFLGVWK